MNLNWAPELVNGGTEDPNFASLDSVVSISLRFSRSTTAEHTTCQYDSGTDTLLYPSISTTWSTTAWPHTCSGGRPAITGVQRIGQCVNVTDAWTPRSVSYDRTVRVCQTTDDARTISRGHTYDASRNNQHSFAATSTAYRFTGKERDAESGNDYFGARYYNPNIGRFISEDPLGFEAGTPDLYEYTYDDPVNTIDPSGDCPWCIVAGVGAGFGAATEGFKGYECGDRGRKLLGDIGRGAAAGGIGALAGLGTGFASGNPFLGGAAGSGAYDVVNTTLEGKWGNFGFQQGLDMVGDIELGAATGGFAEMVGPRVRGGWNFNPFRSPRTFGPKAMQEYSRDAISGAMGTGASMVNSLAGRKDGGCQ